MKMQCVTCHSVLIAVFIIVTALSREVNSEDDLSNGFGKDYDWHSLEEGLELSKESGKPLMLIIHKSWCGACRALKPKFAASVKAQELSQHFVMVNVMDNDEPADAKYKPDGGYIPRILFLDSMGKVHEEIYNEGGNPQYKYYYYNDEAVVESMAKAMKVLPNTGFGGDEL